MNLSTLNVIRPYTISRKRLQNCDKLRRSQNQASRNYFWGLTSQNILTMASSFLGFLFNRKKSAPEVVVPEISDSINLMYNKSEFESVGYTDNEHNMGRENFVRLLQLLGYPGDSEEIQKLWSSLGKCEDGLLSLEEYIQLMQDKNVNDKTNMWRKLFSQFDTDNNGIATKAEVIKGLEAVGVNLSASLSATLEAIDTDNDQNITYLEFLKYQLKQHG